MRDITANTMDAMIKLGESKVPLVRSVSTDSEMTKRKRERDDSTSKDDMCFPFLGKKAAAGNNKMKRVKTRTTNLEKTLKIDRFMARPPKCIRDCDMEDWINCNVNESVEYADIILEERKKIQGDTELDPELFDTIQNDVKPRMRSILFCWLIEVHRKFKLKEACLWLAFSICDRFLSIVDINRNKLQLLGSCCLWTSSKYFEIYPPLARDFVYMSDQAFTRDQIIKVEADVARILKFDLMGATPYTFANRYVKIAVQNIPLKRRRERVKWLAFYAMERVAMDHRTLMCLPSKIAAGGVCSALGMTGRPWSQELIEATGYSEEKLKTICRLTRRTILKFDDARHSAIIAKYEDSSRGSVSMLRRRDSNPALKPSASNASAK